MAERTEPAFSLCPFRGVMLPPADGPIPINEPREILGRCLGPGCGLFLPTVVANGEIKDGICSFKGIAAGLNAAIQLLLQRQPPPSPPPPPLKIA